MELEKIEFETLRKDAQSVYLKIDKNDSYIQAYSEFIKYFKELNSIEKHHFFIASHFVYGWMPKMLNLNIQELEKVLKILNKVKEPSLLSVQELKVLKECINRSMVGVSKLLHFIDPYKYAIWDSIVFKYIMGKDNYQMMSEPEIYLQYLQQIHSISERVDYKKEVHSLIEGACGYKIKPTRAIEMIMYETGRSR